MKLIMVEQL